DSPSTQTQCIHFNGSVESESLLEHRSIRHGDLVYRAQLRTLWPVGCICAFAGNRAARLAEMAIVQAARKVDRRKKVTLGENFPGLLQARGRSREVPETEDVYGWLVGSWELDVVHYKGVDVSSQKIKGEAHFSWVLEGRAIQDVWIMPRASDRKPESERINDMYGTTLRVWDPQIQAWRIRWMNPVSGHE